MDIGAYTILGRLGRGGMGGVYKVRHRALGRIMAMKRLQPHELLVDLLGVDEVRRRFVHEARLMAACEHRNIASVWDLRDEGADLFMVLEYLCMNLGTLIGESGVVEAPSRPVPAAKALDFVRQTLGGLDFLHRRGIVHRDVKPFNLMLGSDGGIKIIDLGLSSVRGETLATPRGLKIGSPYYAAPEQERAPDHAGPRADLYSVGAVLHRLVCGLLPPEPGQPHDAAVLSGAWADFFGQALAVRPDERFADARAMRRALDGLEADLVARREPECVWREPSDSHRPRAASIRTGVRPAQPFLFLTPLFQPRVFHAPDLTPVADGWLDRTTGLVWGRISALPLTWDEASQDTARLARDSGLAWRMPTVEEVVTLLEPDTTLETFCPAGQFSGEHLWLWTGDRRGFTSAWFVDVVSRAVLAQDMTCRFHVRPVRSES